MSKSKVKKENLSDCDKITLLEHQVGGLRGENTKLRNRIDDLKRCNLSCCQEISDLHAKVEKLEDEKVELNVLLQGYMHHPIRTWLKSMFMKK